MSALPILETQPNRRRRTAKPRMRQTLLRRRSAKSHDTVKRHKMSKARARAIEQAFERTLLFCGLAIATFMTSSLVGHVMVEQSRREGIAALGRMRAVKKSQSVLEEQVYALSNVESVQAWAMEHGYRAPEDVARPKPEKTLVALR